MVNGRLVMTVFGVAKTGLARMPQAIRKAAVFFITLQYRQGPGWCRREGLLTIETRPNVGYSRHNDHNECSQQNYG